MKKYYVIIEVRKNADHECGYADCPHYENTCPFERISSYCHNAEISLDPEVVELAKEEEVWCLACKNDKCNNDLSGALFTDCRQQIYSKTLLAINAKLGG